MANLSLLLRHLHKERNRLQAQLDSISKALAALGSKRIRRQLSAVAIARIRAGQKARWAKWRKAQKNG